MCKRNTRIYEDLLYCAILMNRCENSIFWFPKKEAKDMWIGVKFCECNTFYMLRNEERTLRGRGRIIPVV